MESSLVPCQHLCTIYRIVSSYPRRVGERMYNMCAIILYARCRTPSTWATWVHSILMYNVHVLASVQLATDAAGIVSPPPVVGIDPSRDRGMRRPEKANLSSPSSPSHHTPPPLYLSLNESTSSIAFERIDLSTLPPSLHVLSFHILFDAIALVFYGSAWGNACRS